MANTLTYQDLLIEAREIFQDTNTDPTLQRYPDSTLLNLLNRGLQELYRIRPDAFYDSWDATTSDFDVPQLNLNALPDASSYLNLFAIPLMFYDPLVNWVIGMAEAVDDEFTDDSRSLAFRSLFQKQVSSL